MNKSLTVLMFGGGQDSTALLYRLATDQAFRDRYVQGELIVLMSDTGDEHVATLEHVTFIKKFCNHYAIPFAHITSRLGYHPRTWPGLIEWMRSMNGIQAKAYPKSCTDNLKIKPIYNFLERFVAIRYYNRDCDPRRTKKSFLKRFAADHGQVHVLLGIAKGEERRTGGEFPHKWMRTVISRRYPLIEEGMDRQACQDQIRSQNLPLPPPSNCRRCPFMNEVELVWMYRFDLDGFNEWVELEANKVAKWKKLGKDDSKNYGVNGVTMLPQALEKALAKFGHWSNEELQDYKMSHGHCVKSKY